MGFNEAEFFAKVVLNLRKQLVRKSLGSAVFKFWNFHKALNAVGALGVVVHRRGEA